MPKTMNQLKENLQNSIVIKISFILITILCLFPFVSAPMALIAGFLFVLFFGHPFSIYNSNRTPIRLGNAGVGRQPLTVEPMNIFTNRLEPIRFH